MYFGQPASKTVLNEESSALVGFMLILLASTSHRPFPILVKIRQHSGHPVAIDVIAYQSPMRRTCSSVLAECSHK